MQREQQPERPYRTTGAATAAVIVAVMPSFLVGASGVLLRDDLGFGESGLGIAVSVFFGATAMTSVFGGRISERIGASRALKLVGLTSGSVLLGIGLLSQRLAHLLVLLAIGGIANGFAQPASNLAIARGVSARQALMLGVKQSAIPFTTLLAGASVPLVGLTVGWRWSFVAAALIAVTIAALLPRDLAPPIPGAARGGARREGDAAIAPLLALAAAAGAGMAAATAMASFLVESAVADGIPTSTAGWYQAAGSASGVVARVAAGWVADRWRGVALAVVGAMLLTGSLGYAMLAAGGPVFVPLGGIIAYACAWGWTGLMMFAVVRFNPNAPAAATGIVMTGSAGGAALGPFIFGFVVSEFSYDVAWTAGAGAALVSTLLVVVARRWLLNDRGRRESRAG